MTFAGLARVEKVQIFNRADEEFSAKRIASAEITLWNGDTQVKSCGTLSYITTENFPSQSYLINCGSADLTDTVKIEQPTKDFLNLLEVYVLTKTVPQHALKCSKSKYILGRKYMKCPISAGGLAVGDVISALVFYEQGNQFNLRFADANSFPCDLRYRKGIKGWKKRKKQLQDDSWLEDETSPSGSELPDTILLDIKITFTTDSYTFTVNGEALSPLPHGGNFKQITDVGFFTEGDTNATLYSLSLNPIPRGEYITKIF